MQLSESTIAILKNFHQICPSILIRPGYTLKTGTVQDSLQAKAIIKENFDREFAIYDIAKFLAVLSLFKEPELEFTDTQIIVSQGAQSVNYTYASPNMVYSPQGEPKLIEHLKFDLPQEVLVGVTKAMSVLQQTEIAVVGRKGSISFETVSTRNSSSDSYKVVVAEVESADFTAIIKAENWKMLPRNYTIIQDLRGMTSFRSEDLTYNIANELTSKFPKV